MAFENSTNESGHKQGFSIGTPLDLGAGIFHAAIEQPYNGIAQLTKLPEMHIADNYNSHSLLGGAGELLGMTADFVALSKTADIGLAAIGKQALTEGLIGSTIKMGGIGAIYGGVLTPGTDRIKTALTDGLTFGAMGGTANVLQGEVAPGLLGKVKVGAISGAAGGTAHVLASLGVGYDAPTSFGDAVGTIGKYAAFGGLFAVGTHVVDETVANVTNRGAKPELDGVATTAADQSLLESIRRGSTGSQFDAFNAYKQSNYRWVPARQLAADIRTAQGPTIIPSVDGVSRIVGDSSGKINHIRYATDATPVEKANLTLAAGYARLVETDAYAWDMARNSTLRGRLGLASDQHVIDQAIKGSTEYVSRRPGNNYADYLGQRYGEMTPEQSSWGVHIMTDAHSPESGWNPSVAPATESLNASGMSITPGARAAASNPAVLKKPAWSRGSGIRGVTAYADSIADTQLPADAHPMVRDALLGRVTPEIDSPEVGAIFAIMADAPTLEAGELACRDTALVKAVAQLVASGNSPDYTSAYRNIVAVQKAMSSGVVH